MSCCGKNRAAARAAALGATPPARRGAPASPAPAAVPNSATTEIVFEYIGTGSAAIRGPVSGRVYRFAAPGERVRVDARDRPGLAALPQLRAVR